MTILFILLYLLGGIATLKFLMSLNDLASALNDAELDINVTKKAIPHPLDDTNVKWLHLWVFIFWPFMVIASIFFL